MSYQLPPLTWLRAFEAAARYNNFTAAAKELNLTSAAVSHQVRSLEQHLELKLFERLPRSLRLTDKGRAYLPSVRKAFEELSASTVGLFGSKDQQSVRVRCTAALSVLWLAPRLKNFMALYPNIDIRLYTAIWTEALSNDDVDIDIRFGDGNWSGFQAHKFLHHPSVVVATPEIAQRLEKAIQVNTQELDWDINGIQVMGCEGRWQTLKENQLAGIDLKVSLIVDTSLSALQLASAGAGIALVQKSYAQAYLDDGRLVKVINDELFYDESHFVLTPAREVQTRPETLLFKNWLIAEGKRAD